MYKLVSLQQLFVLEALPALVTHVALPRVLGFLVVHYGRGVVQHLPAEIAGVSLGGRRPVSSMADGVQRQRPRVGEPRAALSAHVRTLALVRRLNM